MLKIYLKKKKNSIHSQWNWQAQGCLHCTSTFHVSLVFRRSEAHIYRRCMLSSTSEESKCIRSSPKCTPLTFQTVIATKECVHRPELLCKLAGCVIGNRQRPSDNLPLTGLTTALNAWLSVLSRPFVSTVNSTLDFIKVFQVRFASHVSTALRHITWKVMSESMAQWFEHDYKIRKYKTNPKTLGNTAQSLEYH